MSNNIWIRSQSKYAMISCNKIYVGDFFDKEDEFSIVGFTDTGNKTILGKYSTEKKAVKVLDMIQTFIIREKGNILYAIYQEPNNDVEKYIIFEMPQDDEVV